LRAARAKTFSAKNGPAGLWLEGHTVGLAALVAHDFELFAFGSSASLARTAKVLTASIATGLATLRMAQAALAIIILFSLTKGKSSSAFGTRNFKVWHRYLPRLSLRFASASVGKVYRTSGQLYSNRLWICTRSTDYEYEVSTTSVSGWIQHGTRVLSS